MQQRCPRCKSNRIRYGYRHTPLLLKLVFRYNLLCDNCNWEFNGFAIPGTIPSRTRKKKDKPSTAAIFDNRQDAVDEPIPVDIPQDTKEETGELTFNHQEYTPSNEPEPQIPRDLESDHKIKRKKAKKRVKLRLN